MLVTLLTSQPGTVSVGGRGLETLKKTLGAGVHAQGGAVKGWRCRAQASQDDEDQGNIENPVGSSSKAVTREL